MIELQTRCPFCAYRHDGASFVGRPGEPRVKPHAGAVSVCIACGKVSVFEDDFVGLRLREPNAEEQTAIDDDDVIREVLKAWTATRAKHAHAWPGQS